MPIQLICLKLLQPELVTHARTHANKGATAQLTAIRANSSNPIIMKAAGVVLLLPGKVLVDHDRCSGSCWSDSMQSVSSSSEQRRPFQPPSSSPPGLAALAGATLEPLNGFCR